MKKNILLLFFLSIGTNLKAQVINFADANFKATLLQASSNNEIALHLDGFYYRIDTNFDNEIQYSEASDISGLDLRYSNIYSIVGINNFTNLSVLYCDNNNIESINITSLNNLYSFSCDNNNLTVLELHNLNNLWALTCSFNNLTQLDFSGLPTLTTLLCEHNNITSLSLDSYNQMQTLNCGYNLIQNLSIQNKPIFHTLLCDNNLITTLNLINLPILSDISCRNNQMSSLSFSNFPNLNTINCSNNFLTSTSINLLNQTSSFFLNCDNNFLTFIDSTFLPNSLRGLSCRNNAITNVNFLGINNIQELACDNNQINELNLGGLFNLNYLTCNNNELVELNIRNGSNETTLSFSNNPSLVHVCSDTFQISNVQSLVTQYGYISCTVNTECELSNDNSEFLDGFVLAPNPTKNLLNIQSKNPIEISSISIYNVVGQLVLEIPNAKETTSIDVSQLTSGTYYVKAVSDHGSSNSKFIKE